MSQTELPAEPPAESPAESRQTQPPQSPPAEEEIRLDPESESFLDDVAKAFVESGGAGTGMLLGVSDEQQEQLYAFASMLYESGQYEQACGVFERLCRLTPNEVRFVKALGMARQMAKQYEGALDAYGVAVLQDIEDAEVSIHAAECLLHLGEIGRARAAVKGAVLQAEVRPLEEGLKRKLQVLQEALEAYDAASDGGQGGATSSVSQGGAS